MEGILEKLRQPLKVDISTDDAITPGAVEYKYQLMFEEREISLNTYNIETLLAEKSQTIINNISKVVSKISRPAKGRLLYYSIFGGNFG